ncbi:hypothetical protein P5485_001110 [Bacillus pumilus]|uniref:hypothetical protein n=1 Tax=Bacillus pumilus TaxID=1408 RepID=UPI00077676FA|nr:hypothetical protein [Bacillus pumilus]AMM96031.1 hypothetical protein UP12_01100 [Bacillus pumilus]
MIFGTRSIWYEIGINPEVAKKKFTEYFGEEKRIYNRKESIGILDEIIKEVQSKMKSRMEKTGAEILINQLQNMFSKIYQIYIEQKKLEQI